MRRPLRKTDKQFNEQAQAILERGNILCLAMCQGSQPYVVPMNYGCLDGKIYMHTGPKGLKMEILAENPQVSFTVMETVELMSAPNPCKWDVRYRSVVGLGRASLVEDMAEKNAGLEAIARQCGYDGDMSFPPEKVKGLAVIRIEIEHLSGKQNQME
ncbi:MAG: pyridoxamine 5'-phosphate oxidase family protein [Proteobacteria bacterium]|nr:pyridoxamine 5'-phosphate oxidase family protein [Pseudomonadota bacterium]MBU1451091.1 pyridoxamine 5'-phosphate oxidase family protein [Pseudomonadota bacterium]MBU2467775.1 pyridoxamine 5'-phosphate oxidase family protein [Pseudomonadota bacterium]MBU2517825.1 pyridoxamine 5'-phosphate oxidase family protein [Pseudomonadota bacterium]